jgi:hypothetical protein
MARNANPSPISKEVAVNEKAIAEDQAAQNQLASITQGYSEDRDLMNQLLGQAQMADAIGKFTATVAVSKMAFVKQNKLYQQLRGMKDRDGRGLDGTWDDFCRLLGTSAPKVNEDINNLQSFGEDALESMSRMGIGYREMRQYRKLPEDQKLALIEVAKAGDKESFLDLAEEIITRHAKEKEELSGQLEEAQAEKLATEQVLESKSKRIDQLERAAQRIKAMPANEAGAALRKEAAAMVYDAQGLINGNLRAALEALNDAPDADGKTLFMAGMVGQLIADLVALRDEFNLPDAIGDGTPDWQQWADKQQATAGAAQ